ncbi:MAG: hypothetical protein WD069_19340 [Planctomycetales bacterium]
MDQPVFGGAAGLVVYLAPLPAPAERFAADQQLSLVDSSTQTFRYALYDWRMVPAGD